MKKLFALACLCLAAAALFARFSSAAFTSSTTIAANGVTADALSNYFSITPGSAVQVGTSTPVASGGVDTLGLEFGTVPSARPFTNVFRITNVSNSTQTANLTVASAPQVASAVFASTGAGSVTLAAGASTTVTVTTSATVAGRATGTMRLGLAGASWLYRDYSLRIAEAPEAPGAPSATQKPAGRIDLAWTASATTTNLAGYDLYRSSGAGYSKLNAAPLTGLTYSDTATVDGTAYTYKVRAVSTDAPALESLDSTTATAIADATPPGQPSAIALANGGGAGYAGAGTVTFSGLNVAGLGDGSLTLTATSTDVAGNVSTARTAVVTKDTVAPGAPSAVYADNNNTTPDQISGSAEANASITATRTSPSSSYSTTANGSGSYTLSVAAVKGNPGTPVSVTYTVTARDAAGNTSSPTTLTYSDSH